MPIAEIDNAMPRGAAGSGPGAAGKAARRVALVLNEQSGTLLGQPGLADAVRDSLRQPHIDLCEPAGADLTGRLKAARGSGAAMIVVAGGDGTLACAAGMLENSSVVLGIVPAGTANLLARDLGIPLSDPMHAVRIALTGQPLPIDIGWAGGHPFLCAVMLGSPARLGHHREVGRRRGNGFAGWLHLACAFLRAARRHRAVTYRVTIDGVRHRLRAPSLTIALNALDEPGGRMFGRARLDGGELHAYAVRHRSAFGWIRLAFSILRGNFRNDPAVTVLQGTAMSIDAPGGSLRALLDGEERVLLTPINLRIAPRALTVMAPA